MTAHAYLRSHTRNAHQRVDDLFARFDLSRRDHYAAFLAAHSTALIPAEQALDEAGAASLLDDWPAMRRSEALVEDLRELGAQPPPPLAPPSYSGAEEILGGLYVLEGSRLGADLLRRAVPADFPTRYLDSVHPAGRWRRIVTRINRQLGSQRAVAAATMSALRTFALFERSGAAE